MKKIFNVLNKLFLGKGIDKKYPFLILAYKHLYALLADKKVRLVDIPLGGKLYVGGKDSGLGMYLRTKKKYEPEMTKAFIKIIKKGDVVFDVGANVGYYTILASKLSGKTGKVYAFEPEEENRKLLKKNLRLNKCENVKIVGLALSNSTGKASLRVDKSNPGECRLDNRVSEKNKIRMITLDDFLKKKKIEKPDVMKIDIEGREPWVLLGGKHYFAKKRPVKLFLECNQSSLKEIGYEYTDLIEIIKDVHFELKTIFNDAAEKTYKYSECVLKKQLKSYNYLNLYAVK